VVKNDQDGGGGEFSVCQVLNGNSFFFACHCDAHSDNFGRKIDE
jgi:hypothetical protein